MKYCSGVAIFKITKFLSKVFIWQPCEKAVCHRIRWCVLKRLFFATVNIDQLNLVCISALIREYRVFIKKKNCVFCEKSRLCEISDVSNILYLKLIKFSILIVLNICHHVFGSEKSDEYMDAFEQSE